MVEISGKSQEEVTSTTDEIESVSKEVVVEPAVSEVC